MQQPIIARDESKNLPQPSAGTHQCVCCQVVDIGDQVDKFNGKEIIVHKVVVLWEINEQREDGKRFTVSRRYTLSLSAKSNLRKMLQSWRGKQFTPEELDGFDLSKLIGANGMMTLMPTTRTDGTEGREISALTPIPKDTQKLQRTVIETPSWLSQLINGSHAFDDVPTPEEDDLPF